MLQSDIIVTIFKILKINCLISEITEKWRINLQAIWDYIWNFMPLETNFQFEINQQKLKATVRKMSFC